MVSNFTKRACEFGLTYADAGNSVKDMVFEFLRMNDLAGVKPDMVMLSEEVGKESRLRHYHAYVHFPKKVTANHDSFNCFDLQCHIDNVKRTGNKKSIFPMLKYLTKEDIHPLSTFDWRQMMEDYLGRHNEEKRTPDWCAYLTEGLYADQVVDRLIEDGFASQLANRYFNWSGFIKAKFPPRPPEPYIPKHLLGWKLPEILAMWRVEFLGWLENYLSGEWNRPNSLILIGPSRSGKTEWARSLGPHMYFNNLLNLDNWDSEVDYIILDDFSSDITKYLPCWKCFFGGQKEFTLTDKYRGKKTVKWGKPMIWLSNEDIFKNLNIEHIEFIKKNCTVVVLDKKLY